MSPNRQFKDDWHVHTQWVIMTLVNGGLSLITFWKFTKFQISRVVICFSFIHLIIDWKHHFIYTKLQVAKHLQNQSKIKSLGTCTESSYPATAHMRRWFLWTIHPFLVFSSKEKTRVKTENQKHHIFSNKRQTSGERCPLVSASLY